MQNDLKSLLDDWQPEMPESSDFRRNVWQRIERQRPAPSWLAAAIAWLGRPRVAAGLVAAAVLAGAFAGTEISSTAQTRGYLHSVDPYAQAR